MKIKSILDSVEGLPEDVKKLYQEKDGKFVLQIEGVSDHPEAKALFNALERVREEKKTIETERDKLKGQFNGLPEGFNLTEYNKLKDSAASGDVDARLAEQKDRLEKQHKQALDTITGERDKYKTVAERRVVEQSLTDALVAANVKKAFLPAVKALFKDKIKIVGGRLGEAVAAGDVEIGIQQASVIMTAPGTDFVGRSKKIAEDFILQTGGDVETAVRTVDSTPKETLDYIAAMLRRQGAAAN